MHFIPGQFAMMVLLLFLFAVWLWQYRREDRPRARSFFIWASLFGGVIALGLLLTVGEHTLSAWLLPAQGWQWLEVVAIGCLTAGVAVGLPLASGRNLFPQPVRIVWPRLVGIALLFLVVYVVCRWLEIAPEFGWSGIGVLLATLLSIASIRQFSFLIAKMFLFALLLLGLGIGWGYLFSGLPAVFPLGWSLASTISLPMTTFIAIIGSILPIICRYWLNQPGPTES